MSAVILPFKRTALPEHALSLRGLLLDTIAQSLMADYGNVAWPAVDDAIRAAGEALSAGGTFLDALDASEKVILVHASGDNQPILAALSMERRQRQAAFFAMAARMIEDRLRDNPWNKHYALSRARRVIEGGGTIGAALHHALGDDPQGGAA